MSDPTTLVRDYIELNENWTYDGIVALLAPSPALTREALAAALHVQCKKRAAAAVSGGYPMHVETADLAEADYILAALGTPPPAPTWPAEGHRITAPDGSTWTVVRQAPAPTSTRDTGD